MAMKGSMHEPNSSNMAGFEYAVVRAWCALDDIMRVCILKPMHSLHLRAISRALSPSFFLHSHRVREYGKL